MKQLLALCICTLTILTSSITFADKPTTKPIDIGSRLELMVDNTLIDTRSANAKFVLHHPVPQEVVIKHDSPWEGSGCGYHSIFQDGDKYKMYYKAWHLDVQQGKLGPNPSNFTCYAESKDGIHWENRPGTLRVPQGWL